MSYHAANIETAIVEVLEGSGGSVRTMTIGRFAYGVFDGQPLQAQQGKAIQTSSAQHRFDVALVKLNDHESTSIGSNSNRRVAELAIRIDIFTHLKTTIQQTDRRATRAMVQSDADSAIQALGRANNLSTTVAGLPTNIASGMLLDLEWSIDEEDWKSQILRSHINAKAIVSVVQATDPDDIFGADLEAWYRSDDGTFTSGVVTQLDDRTANANHLTGSGSPAYTNPGDALAYTPDISFDGTDDHASIASGFTLGASNFAAYFLARVDTWSNGVRLFALHASGAGATSGGVATLGMAISPNNWQWGFNGGVDGTVNITTGAADTSYHLVYVEADATNDTIGISIDGGALTSGAYTATPPTYVALRVGTGPTLVAFSDMTFKELLILSAIPTTAQKASALDYFRSRYGMAL